MGHLLPTGAGRSYFLSETCVRAPSNPIEGSLFWAGSPGSEKSQGGVEGTVPLYPGASFEERPVRVWDTGEEWRLLLGRRVLQVQPVARSTNTLKNSELRTFIAPWLPLSVHAGSGTGGTWSSSPPLVLGSGHGLTGSQLPSPSGCLLPATSPDASDSLMDGGGSGSSGPD